VVEDEQYPLFDDLQVQFYALLWEKIIHSILHVSHLHAPPRGVRAVHTPWHCPRASVPRAHTCPGVRCQGVPWSVASRKAATLAHARSAGEQSPVLCVALVFYSSPDCPLLTANEQIPYRRGHEGIRPVATHLVLPLCPSCFSFFHISPPKSPHLGKTNPQVWGRHLPTFICILYSIERNSYSFKKETNK
jgi:hypothetical protein